MYAQRIQEEMQEAYLFTDSEILVEEAYEQGARDERLLQTMWQGYPYPDDNRPVLLQVQNGDAVRYTVGYRTEEWNGENLTHYDKVVGWREIL